MREAVGRNLGVKPKKVNLWKNLKQAQYLYIAMTALILSAYFPMLEKQFLILALISGGRWIVGSSTGKIGILIERGGDYDKKV